MLPNIPLTDAEKLVVEALRENEGCGFNELCNKLSLHVSRPIVKVALDRLVKMRVVWRGKGRRGQKHQYVLTETLTKFEEKSRSLECMWDDLFDKLGQLESNVKEGKLSYQDAGSLLVCLIFEAVPLLPTTLEPSFPLELNERLLSFSANRFRSYWEEIIRLGHGNSDIRDGFQKGCEWLRSYVEPVSKKIEEALRK